jgi:hypothetical protein
MKLGHTVLCSFNKNRVDLIYMQNIEKPQNKKPEFKNIELPTFQEQLNQKYAITIKLDSKSENYLLQKTLLEQHVKGNLEAVIGGLFGDSCEVALEGLELSGNLPGISKYQISFEPKGKPDFEAFDDLSDEELVEYGYNPNIVKNNNFDVADQIQKTINAFNYPIKILSLKTV